MAYGAPRLRVGPRPAGGPAGGAGRRAPASGWRGSPPDQEWRGLWGEGGGVELGGSRLLFKPLGEGEGSGTGPHQGGRGSSGGPKIRVQKHTTLSDQKKGHFSPQRGGGTHSVWGCPSIGGEASTLKRSLLRFQGSTTALLIVPRTLGCHWRIIPPFL